MRVLQIAIALDQLVNTLLGGYADETISAKSYRCRHNSGMRWLAYRSINALFFWQDDHCHSAFDSEKLRAHFPIEYRL